MTRYFCNNIKSLIDLCYQIEELTDIPKPISDALYNELQCSTINSINNAFLKVKHLQKNGNIKDYNWSNYFYYTLKHSNKIFKESLRDECYLGESIVLIQQVVSITETSISYLFHHTEQFSPSVISNSFRKIISDLNTFNELESEHEWDNYNYPEFSYWHTYLKCKWSEYLLDCLQVFSRLEKTHGTLDKPLCKRIIDKYSDLKSYLYNVNKNGKDDDELYCMDW